MARPQKQNLEYFSHDVDMRNSKKMKAVRSKFGPIGYATYCMLIEIIGNEKLLLLRVENDLDFNLLSGDIGIDNEELKPIIDYLIALDLIQFDGKFIRCKELEKRSELVFCKRMQSLEKMRVSELKMWVSDSETTPQGGFLNQSASESTQSKVNKSKVNKNKDIPSETSSGSPFANPTEKETQTESQKQAVNKSQPPISGKAKTPSASAKKKLFENYLPLAEKLKSKILENNQTARIQKAQVESWTNDFRLMVETDKRSAKEIEVAINAVFEDEFWKKNILSAGKLRVRLNEGKLDRAIANFTESNDLSADRFSDFQRIA